MRVLFIIPPFAFRKVGEKIKQKPGFMPAIGLALIATILEKNQHEAKILDLQVNQFTNEEFVKYIKAFKPDIVSLGMLDATSSIVNQIINLTKLLWQKTKTIRQIMTGNTFQ